MFATLIVALLLFTFGSCGSVFEGPKSIYEQQFHAERIYSKAQQKEVLFPLDNWHYVNSVVKRQSTCTSPGETNEQLLLNALPNGDYYCVEQISVDLAAIATSNTITSLIQIASNTSSSGWSRRNGLRVIGNFCWIVGGTPCDLVKVTRQTDVRNMLVNRLNTETDDNAINDALFVMITYFLPYDPIQIRIQQITNETQWSDAVRFRAVGGVYRIIIGHATITNTDYAYLTQGLSIFDKYVRSYIPFIIYSISPSSYTLSQKNGFLTALNAALAVETFFQAKYWITYSIDFLNGGNTTLNSNLVTQYEQQYLSNSYTFNNITVLSSIDVGQLKCWATLMNRERNAFFHIMGNFFLNPVPNDLNPTMKLYVFPTKDSYIDYMAVVVGFGAFAGGLYIETSGILYTFQRFPNESSYSVEELIFHEYGHYLHGRYIWEGVWGDPGFFDQPKGWADEGTAEVWGGFHFNGSGCYSLPLRTSIYLYNFCSLPYRNLSSLLAQRNGYDQLGIFDYANGYSFSYFFLTSHKTEFLRIYQAWRDGTYTLNSFDQIAGISVSTLNQQFHDAMAAWCANPTFFENETLTCIQGMMDTETNCSFPKQQLATTCSSILDCNACSAASFCKMCNGVCVDSSSVCSVDTCSCSKPDLALNKPSTSDPTYASLAGNANDNDNATFWYSYSSPSFWKVDLQMDFQLDSIFIKCRYPMRNFSVSTSQDGISYSTLVDITNAQQITGQEFTFNTVGITARFVQITITSVYSSASELATVMVFPSANGCGTSTTSVASGIISSSITTFSSSSSESQESGINKNIIEYGMLLILFIACF